MPWSLPGQDRSVQRASRMSYCQEYRPCTVSKFITCTSLGGILIMIPSTRSSIKKLTAWKLLVVLFLVLLSLPVHICTQFAILSQDQAAWGEPRPRPRTQDLRKCPHPQSAEPSVRATSLQNPWQPWPTSMRNLHITRISKPQVCRRWTDKHLGTQCRKTGKPGSAPCNHQASQVEQSFMQLASEVAKTHEGYHHDTDRNLRQGPQHTSRSSDVYVFHPMPVCLDTVMLKLHSTQRLRLTRRGEPVTAPAQRQSCQCALSITAHLPTWECIRGHHLLPGTATSPSGNAGPIKLLRTVARACNILAYLPHQSDAAILLLHCAIAQLVDSLSCQQVLQSTAGLSRIEPLLFLRRESVALRDPNSVKSTFHRVQVRHSHINSCQSRNASVPTRPRFILNPPLPHMADTGAGEPANQEERAASGTDRPRRSSPRRYPRSRVRADGTRRRTAAEIEARRKAKREGAGYWATAAARSHSGRPRAGPDHVRSNSRSQRAHEWDKDWGSSHRDAAEEWTWQDKEDWWHGSWWNESSWQRKPSVDTPPWRQKLRPSEPRERTAETPQEEARRLILGPSSKGPEDSAPNHSDGSTAEVPTAKRVAAMMTPGEPSPRASRPPPQPKIAVVRKWREWILLQQLLQDLRKAGADDLLADHVARGNFVKKHGDFHQHPKCRDVPRAGNWILAQMGVLLARGICGSASTPTTYGTCVETC